MGREGKGLLTLVRLQYGVSLVHVEIACALLEDARVWLTVSTFDKRLFHARRIDEHRPPVTGYDVCVCMCDAVKNLYMKTRCI
jgi:hypothetical protein